MQSHMLSVKPWMILRQLNRAMLVLDITHLVKKHLRTYLCFAELTVTHDAGKVTQMQCSR